MPKPAKKGYLLQPYTFEQLSSLTVKSLENVKDFTISNEFGSVQFIGETDITRVDLGDIVHISDKNLEVYDDERHVDKPPVG